jgi:hypothetical protein
MICVRQALTNNKVLREYFLNGTAKRIAVIFNRSKKRYKNPKTKEKQTRQLSTPKHN